MEHNEVVAKMGEILALIKERNQRGGVSGEYSKLLFLQEAEAEKFMALCIYVEMSNVEAR